jgi:hypothetical protein
MESFRLLAAARISDDVFIIVGDGERLQGNKGTAGGRPVLAWWCAATPGLSAAVAGMQQKQRGLGIRSARPPRLGNAARDLRPRF